MLLDLEHRLNADWKLKVAGSYILEQYDAINSAPNGTVPVGGRTVPGLGYSFDLKAKNVSLDTNLAGKFKALGIGHEAVLGAKYAQHKNDDAYVEYGNHYVYDIFNLKPDVPSFSTATPTRIAHSNKDTEQKGIYGTLRSHLTDRLSLILGARVSWYQYANVPNFTASSRMKESGVFTPYLGAVYALTPQWSVYASYADIFQPQSVTDIRFQVLKPIVGANYEAGIRANCSMARWARPWPSTGSTSRTVPRAGARSWARVAGEQGCPSVRSIVKSSAGSSDRARGIELIKSWPKSCPGWRAAPCVTD